MNENRFAYAKQGAKHPLSRSMVVVTTFDHKAHLLTHVALLAHSAILYIYPASIEAVLIEQPNYLVDQLLVITHSQNAVFAA